MDIDLPDVVAEVKAAFDRYEKALITNDVAVLDETFRVDRRTIRYGGAEILYGHHEIAAFRAARAPVGLQRSISRTVITTYGRDFCGGLDPVSPADDARQGRPPDADLGALPRGLARGRRPRQRGRRRGGLEAGLIAAAELATARPK